MPDPIKKSRQARKEDKRQAGIPESNRTRHFKIKAKATDPGARMGVSKEVKVKEISEKQRDRLAKKGTIKKNAENTGKLDATVKKKAGVSEMVRFSASKNAHQKSNVKLGTRTISKHITGENLRQSQEKATVGKYKYVGTKTPEPMKKVKSIDPIMPKATNTKPVMKKITGPEITSEESSKTSSIAKRKNPTGNITIKASSKKPGSNGSMKTKKYFVNLPSGEKLQVDKDVADSYKRKK
jgi:hypothetical protein